MGETKLPIETIRHSTAHVMAAAVLELFPGTKLGVGPVIENGFFYDFDPPRPFKPDDLPRIEKRMREIMKRKEKFVRKEMSLEEAIAYFKEHKQEFKVALLEDLKKHGTTKVRPEETADVPASGKVEDVTIYETGKFVDLCRGPHVDNAGQIGAFKLTSIAGAYWRGSEKNKQLQRIYSLAFLTEEELKQYVAMMAEAEKRDHRKLGKALDLFVMAEEVGPGLPLWTERGATIRRELERFIVDEELKRGYRHVITPDLARVKLYEISGHYPYYKDTMYPVMQVDEDKLVLRPMTCPHHFMLYKDKMRSYRELPIRFAELAKLYRYEKSGELTGLMRVRSFCLADSHIFCRTDQAEDEIKRVINLIDYAVGILGFKKGTDYSYRLSLGDRLNKEKYYDAPKAWDEAEAVLRSVLKDLHAPFVEAKGEAAFYGPKIDIQMKNIMAKEETVFTVQYDFCLPARFNLEYINEKGEKEQPVVVHRSSIGALERTIAFMIEKYAGAFPVWLAPVQAYVAPVGKAHCATSRKLGKMLSNQGIRVEVDEARETVPYKARKAEKQKIPYILVIGDREKNLQKLTVRIRGQETRPTFARGKSSVGQAAVMKQMSVSAFIKKIKKEIEGRKVAP
ncbi:MAG: Threonine-tRNA ligase [Parcubacteria group bacterium GW2011_GWC2_45_7]|nr:MAG: Threonine-tRNA ligase [Parcubacteria group bacterium GW2011_GWC2_45_7]